jgi:predicted nucleic acid-binding protein
MSSTTVIEFTFDTNILFYAFDPRDAEKHRIAKLVLTAAHRHRVAVPLQCLSEFYRSATKKLLAPELAAMIVRDLQTELVIVGQQTPDLDLAMKIHAQFGLQFFDCMMLATASRTGASVLFSEDMSHDCVYEGLRVLNPFRITPEALTGLLNA